MLVLVVALTRGGRPEVAPGRPAEAPRASPAEAAAALSAFVEAVEARDPQALAQVAPAGLPAADELMTAIAANVRSLDLAAVGARYVDQVGTVAEDGSWTGVAELTWRLRGFDEQPARSDVVVRFVADGGGLGIAGFDAPPDAHGRLPLWLRGRLSVARSGAVLAMVDGSQDDADAVAARAVRGIDVVQRVLPDWSSPVVVEVPSSAGDLDTSLGAEPGTYAGIAAVTAAVGGPSDTDGPVHVFVNPDVTVGLRRVGAQVVMSHELVHVATDAVRRPVEPWLLEGFADYVALRGTRLPDRVTLGEAIRAARRDGVPDRLPTAGDFDTRARDLQARYEEAWLACRTIADRVGGDALLAVYGAASSGKPLDEALRRVGLAPDALSALWRGRLDALVS
ncbi:hypothetical protein AAII07_16835 [Microvirga sp. 0TCS3.31]